MTDTLPTTSSAYRLVWRWHFIAGLLVLPVLVMMAITGGAYLFKPELDHLVYRRMEDVPARPGAAIGLQQVKARAEAALHGKVLQVTLPERSDRAVRLLVRAPNGKPLTAFVDPHDGRLTGWTAYGGIMQTVRKIHSLQKFGFWASCIVELTAGWAVVLVGTGVFLWWPRGRRGGVVSVRGSASRRVFWRDLHAVTGSFAAVVVLFLAVTGMPWSMVWGAQVQKWVTAANLYEPAPPARVTPGWMLTADMPSMANMGSGANAAAKPDRPWAMERAPMPASAAGDGRAPISIDRAAAVVRRAGLPLPYALTLPESQDGAYAADYRPDRVEDSRTLYVDQYSGRVLGDVRFRDWGPGAKAIEWGIAVHQGEEYGALNRYLMLAGCLAIVLLAVSAAAMWWMRRPRGGIGVPPAPVDRGNLIGVAAIVAVVGVIYPLVGASFLAAGMIAALARGANRVLASA